MPKLKPEISQLACHDCHTLSGPRFKFGSARYCERCAIEAGLLTAEEVKAILEREAQKRKEEFTPPWAVTKWEST